jgi:peptidoglycan hydrolase-like amidase
MRSGHGVGISGIWATYWARSGWDYKKIIQYYLQWVEISKK